MQLGSPRNGVDNACITTFPQPLHAPANRSSLTILNGVGLVDPIVLPANMSRYIAPMCRQTTSFAETRDTVKSVDGGSSGRHNHVVEYSGKSIGDNSKLACQTPGPASGSDEFPWGKIAS